VVLTLTKEKTLAEFLGVEENEVKENSWGTYGIGNGNEYMVVTDDEADEKVYEEIENSLWAFNAEFIIEMTRLKSGVKSLRNMQENSCEDCNDFIRNIIDSTCGMDSFVKSAIESDGRGHFISYYDGKENENGEYFIYRVN
jgi:hypothetical protein